MVRSIRFDTKKVFENFDIFFTIDILLSFPSLSLFALLLSLNTRVLLLECLFFHVFVLVVVSCNFFENLVLFIVLVLIQCHLVIHHKPSFSRLSAPKVPTEWHRNWHIQIAGAAPVFYYISTGDMKLASTTIQPEHICIQHGQSASGHLVSFVSDEL